MDDHLFDVQMQQHFTLLIIGLLLSCLSYFYLIKRHLLVPFEVSFLPKIRGIEVLKGFAVFILAELIVVPALAVFVVYLKTGKVLDAAQMSVQAKGWLNALIVFGAFVGICRVYLDLPLQTRQQLWNQTDQPWYKQLFIGIYTWFAAYPFVLVFSQAVALLVLGIFRKPNLDQVAVSHLKSVLANPLLFLATSVELIILVPFIEEFLFRGLLQSWLKVKFKQATAAILLTSGVFSIFHYAGSQGISNIELLSSLFLLSCVLGFLYERQRSLWASMGLHAFFNMISILLIFVANDK